MYPDETGGVDIRGARLLLVDDIPANLDVLCELLQAEGYHIYMASSGPDAFKIIERMPPDLILLDVMMPGMDGFDVCRRLKADHGTQAIPVVFITAKDVQDDIVKGFRLGGVDYITKPFYSEEVLARVQTHLRQNRMREELIRKNRALEAEMAQRQALKGQLSMISEREASHWGLESLVGRSATMQRILRDIRLMQENAATSVLITGESGTGKELIARAIHYGSFRRDGPFVPVNCAAMPRELAESLLFGHVRGAFTGADTDRIGYFQMAHEGTLFLDEIGEMPVELQAKLLRVLEDGQVQRLGEIAQQSVDIRVVAATNIDPQERIHQGAFRQDLYYRLARFTVKAPALRERRDDVPLLAQHFLQLFATEMGREAPGLTPEVLNMLQDHEFPGNVRELKNVMERALIEISGSDIQPHHLHFLGESISRNAPVPDLPLDLEEAERWVIKRALARCNGNVSEAARLLGTNRNRIYRALNHENVS
ncbi:MAG: hypothetical protein ETSY2_26495 [Candidatus Entotheonella gemina]|uniref:Chemotaxis protein CheY n=1 Tax=Candidatus Entotheonella gemina TaxID=1429439 RepID=W4M3U4_9BACT|nr:MAG: hypothetical protein ETSY2_26495 [Candidatus Entotheonella gemina]